MSVQRAGEVIALTSSQQTTEEDGSWITSNGQHIFIPNGQDKGEVLKEHFENLNDNSKSKSTISNHQTEMKNIEKDLDIKQSGIDKLTDYYTQRNKLHKDGDSFGLSVIDPYDAVEDKKRDEFMKALEKGDYTTSDKIFAESIKDRPDFEKFKKKEEELHAFNNALENKAAKAKEFHRFIGTDELDSYLKDDPTFGSSLMSLGKDPDFKCLSVEPFNKFFKSRIMVSYPADEIREGSETVNYTQFPRTKNKDLKESIHTGKRPSYAGETEVRIQSTTKMPIGKLKIKFKQRMSFKTRDEYTEKYNSLGTLSFPNAREDYKDE